MANDQNVAAAAEKMQQLNVNAADKKDGAPAGHQPPKDKSANKKSANKKKGGESSEASKPLEVILSVAR